MTDDKLDPRATKILFDTFWSSKGWKNASEQVLSHDDYEYAKQAGLMFDKIEVTHDQIVDRAIKSRHCIEQRDVVDAFVSSLSSRRLHARSALGSFAVLQHFPRHVADCSFPFSKNVCAICGCCADAAKLIDLNVLNFERLKWGGVRHDQPIYASFDLEQFQKHDLHAPTSSDVALLRSLLEVIDSAPAKTTAGQLEKLFAKQLKSNKAERDIIVAILGYCGILESIDHPGYRSEFIARSQRQLPNRHWIDMAYPACWWRRSDGINHNAIDYWFGYLL